MATDAASRLMVDFGFIAFRTPPGAAMPDSCLMAVIHASPTLRHFDPELASYWVGDDGRGHLEFVDHDTPTPVRRRFSWGRIRLLDRLGMRNSFVSFGGTLDVELVGTGSLLLIFHSPAPILRLPGHSQRQDRVAEEVLTFFGRVIPRLWDTPEEERLVAAAAPDELYAAFLLHSQRRLRHSTTLREAIGDDVPPMQRALSAMALNRRQALDAGQQLLEHLGLDGDHR
jgi:hypothetical protein